jgi:hypothetical protein
MPPGPAPRDPRAGSGAQDPRQWTGQRPVPYNPTTPEWFRPRSLGDSPYPRPGGPAAGYGAAASDDVRAGGKSPTAAARSGRPALPSRPLRTDPSLYQWERLSPAQQQKVLAALGGSPEARRHARLRTVLAVSLMALLALALVVLLIMHR